jgi:hypothetical protein
VSFTYAVNVYVVCVSKSSGAKTLSTPVEEFNEKLE